MDLLNRDVTVQNTISPSSEVNVWTSLLIFRRFLSIFFPQLSGAPCQYRRGKIDDQTSLVFGNSALYLSSVHLIFGDQTFRCQVAGA
jgi:hypothetical protein